MATIAAAYGYITEDDDPREWGADVIAADTEELAQIVLKAVNLADLMISITIDPVYMRSRPAGARHRPAAGRC